jgi:hypothetical protein
VIVKHGDEYPIQFTVNMDLTGCAVRLIVQRKYPATDPVVLDSTITDAAGGVVQHTLTGTLDAGDYKVEVEATRDGEVITFPNDGYELLQIIPDLA